MTNFLDEAASNRDKKFFADLSKDDVYGLIAE